jgi:orotidine-5'-phosphate decarboxylase
MAQRNSVVMVGLDPVYEKLPASLRQAAEGRGLPGFGGELWAIREFCERVIEAAGPLACCFKPQIAFFERYGSAGIAVLEEVLRGHRDHIFVVDCKRGDIGSTSEAYAKAYFHLEGQPEAPLACDAVTHNPYLGRDSIDPYLPYLRADKGMFLLAKTSNPSSVDFQDLIVGDIPLAERVAERISVWAEECIGDCGFSSIGMVVGATYPESALVIRKAAPRCLILVPGLETQGGSLDDARHFANLHGRGAVFNFARAIIYAYAGGPVAGQFGPEQWAECIGAAADYYRHRLNTALGL